MKRPAGRTAGNMRDGKIVAHGHRADCCPLACIAAHEELVNRAGRVLATRCLTCEQVIARSLWLDTLTRTGDRP